MVDVKLRDNFRYFDDFDTDFKISAGEIKELPERNIKAYQIKQYLFNGHLKVMSGEVLMMIKGKPCYISAEFENKAYIKENDELYFERDLDLDTLNPIKETELPLNVKAILDEVSLEVARDPKPVEEVKDETEEDEEVVTEVEEVEEEADEDVEESEDETEEESEESEESEEDDESEETTEDDEVEEDEDDKEL